jgi:hypothetical protein
VPDTPSTHGSRAILIIRKKMNIKQIAEQFNLSQYPLHVDTTSEKIMKELGFVVVFGASDDLMEFRGAIHDEIGAYEGTTAFIDAKGLLPDYENLDVDDKEELKDYFSREPKSKSIEAIWCPPNGEGDNPEMSWGYKTEIPHETFFCDGR